MSSPSIAYFQVSLQNSEEERLRSRITEFENAKKALLKALDGREVFDSRTGITYSSLTENEEHPEGVHMVRAKVV